MYGMEGVHVFALLKLPNQYDGILKFLFYTSFLVIVMNFQNSRLILFPFLSISATGEMKSFLQKLNKTAAVSMVRSRINNERAKVSQRVMKRMEELAAS